MLRGHGIRWKCYAFRRGQLWVRVRKFQIEFARLATSRLRSGSPISARTQQFAALKGVPSRNADTILGPEIIPPAAVCSSPQHGMRMNLAAKARATHQLNHSADRHKRIALPSLTKLHQAIFSTSDAPHPLSQIVIATPRANSGRSRSRHPCQGHSRQGRPIPEPAWSFRPRRCLPRRTAPPR